MSVRTFAEAKILQCRLSLSKGCTTSLWDYALSGLGDKEIRELSGLR